MGAPVPGGELGVGGEGVVAAGGGAEAVKVLERQAEENLLHDVIAEKVHLICAPVKQRDSITY